MSSTGDYPIPEQREWIKNRLGKLGERISEVRSLAQKAASAAARALILAEELNAGTPAERDARYGVPATTAERVALANKQVVWFNTVKGWDESFYVATGSAGLTARGLIAGTADGWYPVGEGPWCVMEPTAAKATASDQYIGGWNGSIRRNGGAEWFNPTATVLQVQKAGMYSFGFWSIQQNGSGTANYILRVLNAAGTAVDQSIDGGAVTLSSTLATRCGLSAEVYPLKAGQQIAPLTHSGALTVHFLATIRGQLYAKYRGPALVSD